MTQLFENNVKDPWDLDTTTLTVHIWKGTHVHMHGCDTPVPIKTQQPNEDKAQDLLADEHVVWSLSVQSVTWIHTTLTSNATPSELANPLPPAEYLLHTGAKSYVQLYLWQIQKRTHYRNNVQRLFFIDDTW